MHKQVFLSREAATALDFPVAPLAVPVAPAPGVESIAAITTSFGRVIVANRIPLAEARTWAGGLQHVANDHRYYELTHESLNHQFEHYYLLLQDRSGVTRAIQPFLIVDQDLATGLPGPIRRGLQQIRARFPATLFMRMLMVGCSAGEGHLVRDVKGDDAWVARALGEALQPVARALRARLIVFKDFPQAYREPLGALKPHGFARVPSMPGSSLDLKPFRSFDDYLTNLLSKKTRKNLRLKYRQAAAGTKTEMQVVDDIAPHVDEIFPLYQQVVQKSRYKFEELTKSYFLNLGRTMKDRTVFFIWRQNGRAVAFSSCVVHEGVLRDHYIGLDYAVALESHLYFVTWKDIFTWAIENGCHSYYSAPLNYEPKYHLRHQLVPLDLYVRTVSDWLNPVFGRAIRYLEPTRYDPMIRKFANAHELW